MASLTSNEIEQYAYDLDSSDLSDLSENEDEVWVPPDPVQANTAVESENTAAESENAAVDEELGPETPKELRWNWRKKSFSDCDAAFTGEPINVNEVKSPIEYCSQYFTEEIFELLASQTNLYSVQKTGSSVNCNSFEIKKLFGVHVMMGSLNFPRVRMYWEPQTRIPLIADNIAVNRVFKLRNNLHLVDNDSCVSREDKLWKVRPLLDRVRETCLNLQQEERQSIDEQMIPFKGRTVMKQFVRGKPNPVGLKNFVRCGVSGLVYDFEIYQGKSTGTSVEHKHLGLGGSIVMRLSENIPIGCGYKLYFDNFFTSLPLIRELNEKKIYSIGTIRANRLKGCPLKTEKDLKQEGRGAVDISVPLEEDMCVVRWLDNGVVTLVSSYVGSNVSDKVKRWSAAQKHHVEINRPQIVKEYSAFMGGVDKIDFLISIYRICMKTRKWTLKVIFHTVDLVICNAWLQYQRDYELANQSKKHSMDLLKFRNNIAENLILNQGMNITPTRKRGRPRSTVDDNDDNDANDMGDDCQDENNGNRKKNCENKPVSEVRNDLLAHWPNYSEGREQRCKLEGCKGRSRIQCIKCKVSLCLNKQNNCFFKFHNK